MLESKLQLNLIRRYVGGNVKEPCLNPNYNLSADELAFTANVKEPCLNPNYNFRVIDTSRALM